MARSACIAGAEPISGAAPSRLGRRFGRRPARTSCVRLRSISSTSAPMCAASAEHLKIPLAEAAAGIERRLQHVRHRSVAARHFQCDRLRSCGTLRMHGPPVARLAQLHRSHGHDASQRLLERAAHQRKVGAPIQRPRDRRQQITKRPASIALSGRECHRRVRMLRCSCRHSGPRRMVDTKSSASAAGEQILANRQRFVRRPSHVRSPAG